jgi:hypothetical protein
MRQMAHRVETSCSTLTKRERRKIAEAEQRAEAAATKNGSSAVLRLVAGVVRPGRS